MTRLGRVPRLLRALAVAPLALCGCIYDGAYLVRGTVRGMGGAAAQPLPAARVHVEPTNRRTGVPAQAATAADGSFEAEYRFGGMRFLFFSGGDGRPRVTFSAEGYRSCTVPLRSEDATGGVTRRPCPGTERGCFELEVLLAPESSGHPEACR